MGPCGWIPSGGRNREHFPLLIAGRFAQDGFPERRTEFGLEAESGMSQCVLKEERLACAEGRAL